MAGNNVLLDTNIVAAILNQEAGTIARLDGLSIYVPIIVVGELVFGAKKSGRVQENLNRIDTFVNRVQLLPCDRGTADRYGDVKLLLRRKGRPIPENDIWIAAVALQHDLTLVTRDQHFTEVDGLKMEIWQKDNHEEGHAEST